MLLIYCQLVVFSIFVCSTMSYMCRFFNFVDDVPRGRNRAHVNGQARRCHPLVRRSLLEYKCAFDYACFMLSRGRVGRITELRYLQQHKDAIREARQKKLLKCLTYRVKKPRSNDVTDSDKQESLLGDSSIDTESSRSMTQAEKNEALFQKYQDCTICLDHFKNG